MRRALSAELCVRRISGTARGTASRERRRAFYAELGGSGIIRPAIRAEHRRLGQLSQLLADRIDQDGKPAGEGCAAGSVGVLESRGAVLQAAVRPGPGLD